MPVASATVRLERYRIRATTATGVPTTAAQVQVQRRLRVRAATTSGVPVASAHVRTGARVRAPTASGAPITAARLRVKRNLQVQAATASGVPVATARVLIPRPIRVRTFTAEPTEQTITGLTASLLAGVGLTITVPGGSDVGLIEPALVVGGVEAYLRTIYLAVGDRVDVYTSFSNVGLGSDVGPEFTEQMENEGTITLVSGGETLVLTGIADATEPYSWTPANQDEVDAFVAAYVASAALSVTLNDNVRAGAQSGVPIASARVRTQPNIRVRATTASGIPVASARVRSHRGIAAATASGVPIATASVRVQRRLRVQAMTTASGVPVASATVRTGSSVRGATTSGVPIATARVRVQRRLQVQAATSSGVPAAAAQVRTTPPPVFIRGIARTGVPMVMARVRTHNSVRGATLSGIPVAAAAVQVTRNLRVRAMTAAGIPTATARVFADPPGDTHIRGTTAAGVPTASARVRIQRTIQITAATQSGVPIASAHVQVPGPRRVAAATASGVPAASARVIVEHPMRIRVSAARSGVPVASARVLMTLPAYLRAADLPDVRIVPVVRSESLSGILVVGSGKLQFQEQDGSIQPVVTTALVTDDNLRNLQWAQERNLEDRVWFFSTDQPPWYYDVTSNSITTLSAENQAKLRKTIVGNYWPACGTYFEQRLVLGGSDVQPQTFIGSRTPDPDTGDNRFWDFTLFDVDEIEVDGLTYQATPSDSGELGTEDVSGGLVITFFLYEEDPRITSSIKKGNDFYYNVTGYAQGFGPILAVKKTERDNGVTSYSVTRRSSLGAPSNVPNGTAASISVFAREDVLASHSFEYTVASDIALKIRWMVPYHDYLVIGCDRRIALARNLSPDFPPEVRIHSSVGAAAVRPVTTTLGVVYVSGRGDRIYEAISRRDLTATAEHITEAGVIDLAWQGHPTRRLWALMADGSLAVLAVEPENGVFAWSRVSFSRGLQVRAIAVLPNEDGEERLWAAAQIGDHMLLLQFQDEDDFVDATADLTFTGGVQDALNTDVFPENAPVRVFTDEDFDDYSVDSAGGLRGLDIDKYNTLTTPKVGHRYSGVAHLPQIAEVPGGSGTSFGQPVRIARTTVGVYRSHGGRVARRPDSPIKTDLPYTNSELETAEKTVTVHDDGFHFDSSLYVEQQEPRPLYIRYITAEVRGV